MDIPESIDDLRNLEIPRHRRIWKPFMQKYDCQKVAEIGVFDGDNFNLMTRHNPKVAVAIDSWKKDGVLSRDGGFSQELFDKYYARMKRLSNRNPSVQVYREYSFDAVKHFRDEYFDFVYLDADHTYEACLKDIKDWYPKVKKGRFLVGDDFKNGKHPRLDGSVIWFGVKDAVKKFTSDMKIDFHELPHHGWAIISKT